MNRKDFPLLEKIVYLDNAAGTLKPKQVVEEISNFYLQSPINPHSVDSSMGSIVKKKIINARKLTADLIDASTEEIIFTAGTTDSLNRTALMFKAFLKKGDEILISKYNHVSNIVPWIEVAKETKSKIVFSENIINDIRDNTKVVCYAQMNNTINQNINIKKLYEKVKKHNAVLVNDAAQAIFHEKASLQEADVIAFSGNKIYGPTGIGVLAIKKELLSLLKPATFGGGATGFMKGQDWKAKEGYRGFEAGTPNTAGILGLAKGIEYFNNIKENNEKEIANYAYDKLSKVKGIKIITKRGDLNTLFNYKNYNSQDIVSYLGHKGIILRSGLHCAKIITEIFDIKYSIRLSIAAYNNKTDIDKLIKELKNGGDFIDFV